MIQIKNLTYKYTNSPNLALDNVTLNINEGEFICILGSNGSR